VETQIDWALRLRAGDAPCTEERFRQRRHTGRLVVELDVVAYLRPLHERGVDPVDPGPPMSAIHGSGAAQHQNWRPIENRVEDRYARVLQAYDVVDDRRHRGPASLGVTVGQGHGDLLVGGQDEFGGAIAAIVDERIVQPPVRGARVESDVVDADGA